MHGATENRTKANKMSDFRDEILDIVSSFGISAAVDIVLVAGALYWILLLLRGTTAMSILRGAAVLLVVAFFFIGCSGIVP